MPADIIMAAIEFWYEFCSTVGAGGDRHVRLSCRIDAVFHPTADGLRSRKCVGAFVATLVDVTGLVIYFSIALVFLSGTLL